MSRFAPYPVLLSKEAAFKHQRSPDEPGPRSRLAVSRDSAPEEPQACTLGELLLPRPPHLFPTLGYFAGPKLYIFVFLSLQGKWGQAAKRSRGPWTDTGPRSLVSQSYSLSLPFQVVAARCYIVPDQETCRSGESLLPIPFPPPPLTPTHPTSCVCVRGLQRVALKKGGHITLISSGSYWGSQE